jgi:hypothetical protein
MCSFEAGMCVWLRWIVCVCVRVCICVLSVCGGIYIFFFLHENVFLVLFLHFFFFPLFPPFFLFSFSVKCAPRYTSTHLATPHDASPRIATGCRGTGAGRGRGRQKVRRKGRERRRGRKNGK